MTITTKQGIIMFGNSTDTKPSYSALQGAMFYEEDTGNIYRHDGSSWVRRNANPPTSMTVVYKDAAGTYYAVNSLTGSIISSGSTPNTPIQDALNRKGKVVLSGGVSGAFVDYDIDATGFTGFTLKSNTAWYFDANARLAVPSAYTGSAIKNDTQLRHSVIIGYGGQLDEQATSSKLWTGIDLNASADYIYANIIRGLHIKQADTSIKLSVSNNEWLNSNIFADLNLEFNARSFIQFNGSTQDINRNNFDNIHMQAAGGEDYGVENVIGHQNNFIGCTIWDLSLAPTASSMTIGSLAHQTLIEGGEMTYQNFIDNGTYTMIRDRLRFGTHGTNINQWHHGLLAPEVINSFRYGKYGALTQAADTEAMGIWQGLVTPVGTASDVFGFTYGLIKRWTSGATSGDQGGVRINKLHTKGRLAPSLFCRFKVTDITNCVGFIGFTDDASAFRTGSTPLANREGIGLWWDSSAGNFRIMSNDGSASAALSSSISSLDTNYHEIEIRSLDSTFTNNQGKWQYKHNDGSWTDITAQLPAENSLLTVQGTQETTTTATKRWEYNCFQIKQAV